jgi:tetratricopeptide (TPR) repeat protein
MNWEFTCMKWQAGSFTIHVAHSSTGTISPLNDLLRILFLDFNYKVMKKYLLVVFVMLLINKGYAQTKPVMPDVNKLMKMSPAELEAYKQKMLKQYSEQAKQIATEANFKLDETVLPDYKIQLPTKDVQRLSLIPQQPPTLIQLSDMLRTTKQQIVTIANPVVIQDVKKMTEGQDVESIQQAAIGAFYADKPEQAVLAAIEAAFKNSADQTSWNNLAAIFNMTGLEHKSVPILMNQLQADPNNSMMLNNMGQAYLGLGDIGMAELFLKQCLQHDPLHPEANRSMGMIRFYYEQYDEGMRYFEKELEVAYRRSTMALMKGKNKAFNIYKLRKKRNVPSRNFFGELQFGKFKVPALPQTTDETAAAKINANSFGESVAAEMLYWNDKAQLSKAEIEADGKRIPGIYSNYVEALLEDLHEVYTAEELHIFNDIDLNQIRLMLDDYNVKLMAVKCPQAPAGATFGEQEAYIKKCCDIKKPIMDDFVAQYNSFVTKRGNRVLGIWKEYLNDLINIASLEPSAGNKIMVYRNLQQYCNVLASCTGGQFLDPPMECSVSLTSEQADSLIASARNLDLSCPKWLNVEVDVKVAKIKADCDKYAIEVGKLWQAGYEHNFRTGTTTLSAGVGAKAKFFANTGGADLKAMVYMSFDNNNQISDVGIMGKASVKIGDTPFVLAGGNGSAGGTLGGTEGMVKLGFNSGFTSGVKGTGALAEVVEIDKSL